MTKRDKFDNRLYAVLFTGGGGGRSAQGLANYHHQLGITYAGGTWDSGGGSGMAVKAGQIPIPPGDNGKGLLALSREAEGSKRSYLQRDENEQSTINRLLISAYRQVKQEAAERNLSVSDGEMYFEAVKRVAHDLKCAGQLIPATVHRTHLKAVTPTGQIISGEHQIDIYEGLLSSIQIESDTPDPLEARPELIEAIEQADILICGPGSFFTSVTPFFAIDHIRQAVLDSKAPIIGVANLVNELHTKGWTAYDYGRNLSNVIGRSVNIVLANNGQPPEQLVSDYQSLEGKDVVQIGQPQPGDLFSIMENDYLSQMHVRKPTTEAGITRLFIRHSPIQLAADFARAFSSLGFDHDM